MDAMTCEHQLVQALKESGNRPAPRRLVILSAVRRADGRIAASEAPRRVQRSYSFIDARAWRPAPFGRRRDCQSADRETETADR